MAGERWISGNAKEAIDVSVPDVKSAVESVDSSINAVREADWERDKNEGELGGIPVSVKDNICVEGMHATAGSSILESYQPPFTATVVERLEGAGATVVAKTNQDAFGFGTFCTNSGYEVPRNPYDTDRSTGGSSGGAAALTAALDKPHVALGQSTGGSISCPAAFCGVVGITPTYGRVSRYGLIDYANSLDKIGPIANSVYDAAAVLDIIAGRDDNDYTTIGSDEAIGPDDDNVDGMSIGVPKQYMNYEGVDEQVRKTVWEAIERFEELGASYEMVSIPEIGRAYTVPAYYIIAVSEASTNLARYCGMRYGYEEEPRERGFDDYFTDVRTEGFGEETKRRILLGHFARMAGYREEYYIKAMKVRRLVIDAFREAFEEYDALVAPTMPMIAPKLSAVDDLSPVEVYAMDTLTVGPNLAGLPHLSLPTGKVNGMPVGTHLIGDQFRERDIIKLGMAYEDAYGFIDDPECGGR